MIDPLQLPILLKAIDFIFDEGHKIMQERRERRKTSSNAPQDKLATPETEIEKEVIILEPEKAKEIKQNLQNSKIDELLWKNHELEVQHLVRLLETYSLNYHLAREQYAKWGDALVPPIIMHNMVESENSMTDTLKKLEAVLSRVYKKDIQPNQ